MRMDAALQRLAISDLVRRIPKDAVSGNGHGNYAARQCARSALTMCSGKQNGTTSAFVR